MENYHEKYASFYNSKEWKQLRKLKYADANGLCEKCFLKGIIKEGVDVHHKIPIEDDWDKRLDYSNLMLLCKDCHNEIHDRESPLQQFLKEFDNIGCGDKNESW